MSVIIRLQNLPWAANAADIRQYFQGLSIPEGGVHIVGGEKGDAFISFSTDEDARQAMLSDGGCIKDVQIRLLLSSRNEMQKVIETARQQTMQFTQVYMQQMQQPQLPIVGALPPLTAKVLPQPQQQVRPDRMLNIMPRNPPMMDDAYMGMHLKPVIEKQQLQQQQQQEHPHLSPKSLENKDREDKSHKRERTRSKSRDRRSKSSRSSSRRDRSRSRDRRRRDRSRGRDRSRDRYRGGNVRNSSSRGSGGGKSHRSRSPGSKSMTEAGSKTVMGGDQQPQQVSVRPWNWNDNSIQQHGTGNHQPTVMVNSGSGVVGTVFGQFRTPPQPPVIPSTLTPNPYQQPQQQPSNANDWTMGSGASGGGDQQPYVPNNDFRSGIYGSAGSDDDEDDRQAEYDNNFHRRYNNDNTGDPGTRRGPPGQDYNQQQQRYGGGPNRGPRFHKQPSVPGGQQNRGGHRQFDDFRSGGASGGPRFNNHQQQQPRYGGGGHGIPDGGARPSRFSSIHEGGRPSRFNSAPLHKNDISGGGPDFSADDSNNKGLPQPPPRFNDRYRYDVRNAVPQTPLVDGLCVEVNNMSNHFSYGDVRKLFDGIHIDGSAIKIQRHRQGVAFVRFDNNHNKNLALAVNGTLYKGNNIAVKHLDNEAYERDNTDDRPYPSTGPMNIVDHVDLVDDDEDDDKATGENGGQSKKPQKKVDDASGVKDNGNPVASENTVAAKDAVATAADGEEHKSSSSSSVPQQQQKQQSDPPTKYLQLKQLPISVTEEEILNEMDGAGEIRRVTFYPDGEFMGAALEFNNLEEAENALKQSDCVLLGSTPVPVLRCSYKEYVQIKRKSGGGGRRFSSDGGSGGGSGSRHHHHHQQQLAPSAADLSQSTIPQPPSVPVPSPMIRSNCVYVYGLPTTVTNTCITQFFSETSVLPDKIHIMLNKFGRPTGESYCEFGNAQQAHTAMAKDQCYMGPNLVYVESISRSDMIQAITKPMQQHKHQQDMWCGGGGIIGGGSGMRGGGAGGGPRQQHNNILSGPRQQQQQPSYGNTPYGSGRPHQQPYMNSSRGGGGGYTPRMRGPGPNTGPDGFGQPGCVVALDNVPYRADVQEIVDFFDGFELNSQNVIRRFNDFGKPTGEARVNLRNPQEALRAVRVLQNKPIFNRPVRLTLL